MLLPWNLKTNHHRGKWAEFLARMYLRAHGYTILAHNYINHRGVYAGEIDIVAYNNRTVIFVEVKQRRRMERALYSITPHQRERINYMAYNYMRFHPEYKGCDVRFDAVFVRLPFTIKHIINAWTL